MACARAWRLVEAEEDVDEVEGRVNILLILVFTSSTLGGAGSPPPRDKAEDLRLWV